MDEEIKLTPKQELFINCILEGKTQHEAYITAYPTSKKWTRNAIDVAANHMMDKPKVRDALRSLGWQDKSKLIMTRDKMLKRLDKVMQKHEEEMDRIQKAYDVEKQKVMEEIQLWTSLLTKPNMDVKAVQSQIDFLTQHLIDLDKVRTLNSVNTNGIIRTATVINRMMGYDITKVEVTNTDEEREEMEKLSAEELKELINISKKEN